MAFNIALSGLNAASSDLEVTANNIANTATTGFKGSRAQFAELYNAAGRNLSATQTGSGVRLTAIAQQFSAGNVENTGNSLDFALSGDGFFTLHDSKGYSYTRAGAFGQDSNGFVVNPAGQRLQVFPAVAGAVASDGRLSAICTLPVALAELCAVVSCRSRMLLVSKLPPATAGNTCSRWPLELVTKPLLSWPNAPARVYE